MLNNTNLQGRLVKDLDLRYLSDGTPVGSITIAVERNYKNRDGEKDADFVECTIWGKTAEVVGKYFSKGDMIIVSGELKQERWENKQGQKRSKLKVKVNSFNFPGSNSNQKPKQQKTKQDKFEKQFDDNFDADDFDVPF